MKFMCAAAHIAFISYCIYSIEIIYALVGESSISAIASCRAMDIATILVGLLRFLNVNIALCVYLGRSLFIVIKFAHTNGKLVVWRLPRVMVGIVCGVMA